MSWVLGAFREKVGNDTGPVWISHEWQKWAILLIKPQ